MQMKFDRLSTIYRSGAILIIRVDDTGRAYDIARYVPKHGSPASGYEGVTAAASRVMAAIESSRKA